MYFHNIITNRFLFEFDKPANFALVFFQIHDVSVLSIAFFNLAKSKYGLFVLFTKFLHCTLSISEAFF